VDFFHRLWSDERVAQTIGGVRQRAQVTQTVERSIEHWESHGFGRWVLLRENAPVGTVKLEAWANDGVPEVELGYALLPGNWGVGYATEAAAGALDQARLLGAWVSKGKWRVAQARSPHSVPRRERERALAPHAMREEEPLLPTSDHVWQF
jgi:hypothetical protein